MADAFGVGDFNGPADMAAEAFVGDEAGSEFSRVHRDMNLGVDAVQIVDHLHLHFVIGHGEVSVFGHDEIDSDDARVGGMISNPSSVCAKTCSGGKPRSTW